MADRASPLVRIAGKYGAIGGLVLTFALIGLYFLGKHPLMIPPVFDLRILLFALFIVLAIKEFKDQNGKVLHFWQGMAMGIICYVMMTFLTAILLFIFGGILLKCVKINVFEVFL